jgi:heme-degrading monooxygenase HmoA
MINIFVSRPTWIAEEFKEGLAGFLAFLDTQDIKPRTLGSTDYAIEPPLDEVITLMNDCQGAIILGYPEIYVTKGTIKEEEKTNFLLPTEWNHIEATLAYTTKKPLLVIHHKGISRGIYEHGAMSKFIHEKDLSEPNWFKSDDMVGVLKKWKESISKKTQSSRKLEDFLPRKATTETKLVLQQTSETTLTKPPTNPSTPPEKLDKAAENLLMFLFKQSSDLDKCVSWIAKSMSVNIETATYYIEILLNHEMIKFSGVNYGEKYYSLTHKGREYIIKNKLG